MVEVDGGVIVPLVAGIMEASGEDVSIFDMDILRRGVEVSEALHLGGDVELSCSYKVLRRERDMISVKLSRRGFRFGLPQWLSGYHFIYTFSSKSTAQVNRVPSAHAPGSKRDQRVMEPTWALSRTYV